MKGRPKIVNGLVVDPSGQPFRLQGINYHELSTDYTAPGGCDNKIPYPLQTDDVKKWGFNTVRLTLTWDALEQTPPTWENGILTHHWDTSYLTLVDNLVKDLTDKDIGVVLDMHQYLWSSAFRDISSDEGEHCGGSGFPAWIYQNSDISDFQTARCQFFAGINPENSPVVVQDGFIEVWKFIAGRYATNPKVIAADIINEPWAALNKCTPEELHLNAFYEKVGSAIREVNPDIILILEDSQDYDNGDFALQEPLPFSNVMYSFHLYTRKWQPEGLKRLERYQTRAKTWNVPLFVGEFNAFDYGRDENAPPTWKSDLQKLLSYFRQNNVHWTYWSYSGKESLIRYEDKKPKEELLHILRKGF